MRSSLVRSIAIAAATLLFLLGVFAKGVHEDQEALRPSILPVIFIVSVLVVVLAYFFELIASALARLIVRFMRVKRTSNSGGVLLSYGVWLKTIALAFGSFGLGALVRAALWKDYPFAVGVAFLALSTGMLLGFELVSRCESARKRRQTSTTDGKP